MRRPERSASAIGEAGKLLRVNKQGASEFLFELRSRDAFESRLGGGGNVSLQICVGAGFRPLEQIWRRCHYAAHLQGRRARFYFLVF